MKDFTDMLGIVLVEGGYIKKQLPVETEDDGTTIDMFTGKT